MRSIITGLALFAALLAVLWVASCTSKSDPAAPIPIPPGAELSGSLGSTGGKYAHTFNTAGTFNYRCTIHSSCGTLHGTIVVVSPGTGIQNDILAITIDGGSAGGPYGGASCSALSNQRDTVHVGEQVTWTNNSPLGHNVTSN